MVVTFSGEPQTVKEAELIEEKKGSLAPSEDEDKLMRSVLQSDKKTIDDGKLISESLNQGLGVFNPEMMLEQMIKNYSLAKKLYGPKLLRLAFEYDPDYLRRNVKIPEFQKALRKAIETKKEEFKQQKLTSKGGTFLKLGIKLSAIVTLVEELEKMFSKGNMGFVKSKIEHPHGDKYDIRDFKKGDRFRDVSVRDSIKRAARRLHPTIEIDDLKTHTRRRKGELNIIYAIDASSSMKGDKLDACKRTGMALTYQALQNRDKVGLIAFGSEIKKEVRPTNDFWELMESITGVIASKQTDFAKTIKRSIELFPEDNSAKHLVLITDAVPTVGDKPEAESYKAAGYAKDNKITISLVGISLEKESSRFAKKLVDIGAGRFYAIKNLDNLDQIVLQDYQQFSK